MLLYYLYFRNRHSNRRLFCQNSKILVMPIQHWHGVWPRRRPASESSVSRNRKMRSFKVVGWSGWSIIEEGLKKRKVRVEVSYIGNMEAFAFVSLPGWKGTSRARCLLRASLLAYQIRHCVTWKQFFFSFFLAIISSCFVLLPTFSSRCRVFFWPRDVSEVHQHRFQLCWSRPSTKSWLAELGWRNLPQACGIQNDLQSIKHREWPWNVKQSRNHSMVFYTC